MTAANSARPALWQVSDADTTIYLFGTFHALPWQRGLAQPAINQVMAQSDGLVLETMIDETRPSACRRLRRGSAYAPGYRPS